MVVLIYGSVSYNIVFRFGCLFLFWFIKAYFIIKSIITDLYVILCWFEMVLCSQLPFDFENILLNKYEQNRSFPHFHANPSIIGTLCRLFFLYGSPYVFHLHRMLHNHLSLVHGKQCDDRRIQKNPQKWIEKIQCQSAFLFTTNSSLIEVD